MAIEEELNLKDGVTGTAKRAADALSRVEQQAKKAQKALDFSKEVEKAHDRLNKLKVDPAGFQKLLHVQRELAEQRKKLGAESFGEAFTKKLSFGKLAGAAFVGELAADALIEGAMKAVEILADGIKEAFGAAAKQETLNLAFKQSFGEAGDELLERAEKIAKLTGFGGSQVQEQILPLARVGLRDKALDQAYALAGDIAVGQGRAGSGGVEENAALIAKVFAKEGFSEKLLTGINAQTAKGFYADLSKATGLSKDEAKKRATEGKLDPQLIVNTLTKAVEKNQGGQVGTGLEKYEKTFESRSNRIKRIPEEFFEKLVNSKGFSKVEEKMGDILKALDPDGPNGEKIIKGLEKAMDTIGTAIEKAFTPENIETFVEGITKAVDVAGELVSLLESAVNLLTGETLSKALFAGDKGTQKVNDILFKEKELKSGSFSGAERKERESEIERMKAALAPSEKLDYANTAAPAATKAGAAKNLTVAPVVTNTVNIYPEKGDEEGTQRAVEKATQDPILRSIEQAASQGGGF